MSMLLPISINGSEYEAHGEYTSRVVANDFRNSLAAFVTLFNLGLTDGTSVDDISQDNIDDVLAAFNGGQVTVNGQPVDVEGFITLLKDGVELSSDPNDPNYDPVLAPKTVNRPLSFLSIEMAGALNQIIASMKAAGIQFAADGVTPVASSVTTETLSNWRNLAATSTAIQQIIEYAESASGDQNRTLQALVELIYVRTGNELLAQNLERLEEAVGSTKDTLETLNGLQTLHNQIQALNKEERFSVFASDLYAVDSPSAFVDGVTGQGGIVTVAEEYFSGIDPSVDQGLHITQSNIEKFVTLRNEIREEISALDAITGSDESGTLVEKLRIVYEDIQKAFDKIAAGQGSNYDSTDPTQIGSALTVWILDSQIVTDANKDALNISGVEPGEIQRNMTAAISAAQSLNDTQKEEVRRYLFVFEEYYKSAAAILSKLTQLLERMAQAIAR